VAKIYRRSNEQTKIFAENWHNDWFHMKKPPIGTMLYAVKIPSIGGDTLFSDLYESYNDLSDRIKNIIKDKIGINSAKLGYAPEGAYGEQDQGRSMDLFYDDTAYETQEHSLITVHPESNRTVINCNLAYTIGIKDLNQEDSRKLLHYLFRFQTQEKYIYRLKWNPNDLTIWDNRCTLHKATGGYDGHERLLYRVTIK
jgi:taurine dioxygenase